MKSAFLSLMRVAIAGIVIVMVGAGVAGWAWYSWALQPRSADSKAQVKIVVPAGATAAEIADILATKGLIRSELAFRLHVQLSGAKTELKAGGYAISQSQSVNDIVSLIRSGRSNELNVTILPGLTIRDIKKSLIEDGFSEQDVEAAFSAAYDHPVLASLPAGQGLEGYLFPDTYRVNIDASARDIIRLSLDQMQASLAADGLQAQLATKGYSVHAAVTLASIIQKEVSNPSDQRQVAQVFESRLGIGMMLGSDVTFMYAAKELGVPATIDLDSPYNTRRYNGLPPGPIANFNLTALQALANPAPGDYLYFVAGDDGTTHYARTFEEHEANIAAYCHTLCS